MLSGGIGMDKDNSTGSSKVSGLSGGSKTGEPGGSVNHSGSLVGNNPTKSDQNTSYAPSDLNSKPKVKEKKNLSVMEFTEEDEDPRPPTPVFNKKVGNQCFLNYLMTA